MQRVLAFNRYYLPGYQAGGPIVSLANIVSALGEEFSFSIITSDRDINDSAPYPGVSTGTWMPKGRASVLYLNMHNMSTKRVASLIRSSAPDVVYLNSFFDTWFTSRVLAASRLAQFPPCRLILAPRGEFSAGALAIRPFRKRAYIAALRGLGVLNHIEWHASTHTEAEELSQALSLNRSSRVHIAADIGLMPSNEIANTWEPRALSAPLRVCFLSRISPKKNLLGAIKVLSHMQAPAHLDIFGPKEDAVYWADCEGAISQLPQHVTARYRGAVAPTNIHSTLVAYDVMLFPTFGENYGHVIPEALSVGLPVVTSDRTPWRGLTVLGVGYDGPLLEKAFAIQLDRFATLNPIEMRAVRERAKLYARTVLCAPETIIANRNLFSG